MSAKATSGSECIENFSFKTDVIKMDSCRICAGRDNEMTNIFEEDKSIIERIFFVTGIQFTKEDGLPLQMCQNCLRDLSIAYGFKTTCIAIVNSIANLSKTNVKTESADEARKFDDEIRNKYDEIDTNLGEDTEEDNVMFKRETEVGEDTDNLVKVEGHEESKLSEVEPKITANKKRGPYKKNGKLKTSKKDTQPKVKKKAQELNSEAEDQFNSKYYLKRLRCEPCGLVFESREAADRHRDTAHKVEAHAWVCEICGQKFTHRGSLSTHIRSHFPPTFACQQCSYRAAHKYDLTKHQRIHAGERPFQCDMCPASFYDASNMNGHIRRNHQKLMNYRCEVCGRGFYDRSKLNRHVDSHNNIKRHSCTQCGCAFTRLSYLKTHLHKRHGIRLPPRRPGPRSKNLLVDIPPVEYVKPTLISVKQDAPV